MMDAIKFVKQLRRMNEQGVPKKRFIYPCAGQETDPPEEVVAEVEEWAKEHPAKTRQSEFLKLFPYARVKKANGLPIVSPCDLDVKLAGKCEGIPCQECWKKFWLAEVEDV